MNKVYINKKDNESLEGVILEDNIKEKLELKVKKVAIIIIGILNIIICLCLNFNEFLMGSPIISKNVIVTISYLLIWSLIIFLGGMLRSKKLLKIFLGFWISNLLLVVITVVVVNAEMYSEILILFVIIILGPMYGVYFEHTTIIIGTISIIMSMVIYYLIKRKV